jgi:hypothetical protein
MSEQTSKDRPGLGSNVWGNLGSLVAPRYGDPTIRGVIVGDMGDRGWLIATDETGWPILVAAGSWIGVGSPWHEERMQEVGGD